MQMSINTTFPQVMSQLSGLKGQLADKVLARAVNRTIDLAKTAMNREIRSTFNVKAAYVRDRLYVRKATHKAGRVAIEAELTASGRYRGRRSANVIAFGARQVGKGVSVLIKRGSKRKVIRGAFIGNKGRTVFHRVGRARLPIKPVQTIDIPQMFNTRKVNAAVVRVIHQRFPEVFRREAAFAIERFNRGGA